MKYVKGFFYGAAMLLMLFWGLLSVVGVAIHLWNGAPLPGDFYTLYLLMWCYTGAVVAWPAARLPARLWQEAMS